MDNRMFWYNFDTDDYDFIEEPDDCSSYVPKGAARSLYHLYVDKMGKPQDEAMLLVLEVCAGKDAGR